MTRKIILAAIIVLLIGISAASIRTQEVKSEVTVNVTLYGSASFGWGFTNTSMNSPGPTITINQFDYLNLTLYSYDGASHWFFVDYNNNNLVDSDEPNSTVFSSSTVFEFNATIMGTFTYKCAFHYSVMYGTLIVQQAIPEFPPSLILPLFTAVTITAAIAYKMKNSAKKMPNAA